MEPGYRPPDEDAADAPAPAIRPPVVSQMRGSVAANHGEQIEASHSYISNPLLLICRKYKANHMKINGLLPYHYLQHIKTQ